MSGSEPGSSKAVIAARSVGAALVIAALVGACSGELKTDYQKLQEVRTSYVAANPTLDDATKDAIRAGELRVGMTPEEVAAAWGRPVYINRFENGRQVEWLFGCDYPHLCSYEEIGPLRMTEVIHHSRAYFYDGRLTAWRRA